MYKATPRPLSSGLFAPFPDALLVTVLLPERDGLTHLVSAPAPGSRLTTPIPSLQAQPGSLDAIALETRAAGPSFPAH
ncbi:MAG: hypothetical protein ABI565_01720 [Vicinamibacteria bacterium]